ncbi:hypothetical protein [Aliiruegeria lutimaris]|uniref:Uncharacterized protein n=1 Tax=Aliiruegeria lutimaris TaxID=571298 RepID=A0A1G9LWI6_9RHOB|nr:hypothetical protein [Aliiruegeria lutimaris]SDL65775.1 hypothetical protein SAMN04488026_11024 [Aliiruegeria lutimaris]
MTRNSSYIFTHATEIAERRGRYARLLQAQEVKRTVLGVGAATARLFQGLRQMFGQAERS